MSNHLIQKTRIDPPTPAHRIPSYLLLDNAPDGDKKCQDGDPLAECCQDHDVFTANVQGQFHLFFQGRGSEIFEILYVQEEVTRSKILNRTILSN